MSFYKLLYGENPDSDTILALINLKKADFGRFRDVGITKDGQIKVYTRNGGANRKCRADYCPEETTEDSRSAKCPCSGCSITYRLPQHPNYIADEDDSYDNTYATIYFSIPPQKPEK